MDTLYHYCSTASFVGIVTSRTIRLSSLSLSNDSLEGRLLFNLICEWSAAGGIPKSKVEKLQKEYLNILNRAVDGFGFCLSSERDQLSQWRGYADDGYGVSIGFSSKAIGKLVSNSRINAPELQRVIYDQEEQKNAIKHIYEEIEEKLKNGALDSYPGFASLLFSDTDRETRVAEIEKKNEELFESLMKLFDYIYRIKSSAFKEEMEWRILSTLPTSFETLFKFRAARDRVVPYLELALDGIDEPIINEVLLGPKHITGTPWVRRLLDLHRFGSVAVHASEASYR